MHSIKRLMFILPLMMVLQGCQQSLGPMSPAVSKLVEQAAVASQQGQTEVARCRLSSAVAIDPENALALYNWGVLENQAGLYDVSAALLEKANKLSSGSSDTLYVLLDSQYKQFLAYKNDKKHTPQELEDLKNNAMQTAEAFLKISGNKDEGRASVEQLLKDLKSS